MRNTSDGGVTAFLSGGVVEETDTDPDELRELLVDLVKRQPDLAAWIESRLEDQSDATADDCNDRSPDINRESIRGQVRYVLQPSNEHGGRSHDPYAAVEIDVEELG